MVIDGDWFLFALKADDIKEMLRATTGDEGGRLAGNARLNGLLSRVGGTSGMGVSYQHAGRSLKEMSDMMKMAFGFIGMMGAAGDSEFMLDMLNPQNIPPGEVFERYFGETVSATKIIGMDLVASSWAPNPLASQPK
jgi:hypothetical protein